MQEADRFTPFNLDLFEDAAPPGIPGLRYQAGFLAADEERRLIACVRGLALEPALYKGFSARRKVRSFGGSFDDDENSARPSTPLPAELDWLRSKVASWLGLEGAQLVHALVAEYQPGAPLGWHRDMPDFEAIAGVSLGAAGVLRFRPYPPENRSSRHALRLHAAPRSVYAIEGQARWGWQHSVLATQDLRWSITFRTRRTKDAAAGTEPAPDR